MWMIYATMMAATLSAQTILMGDTNNDGQLTVADVTSTVNMVLGKSPAQTVELSGMPYRVDNSMVVGNWKAPDDSSLTLNADGTTDYPGGATYKFRPFQGTLTFYDALGNPVRTLVLVEVGNDHLLAVDYATQGYTLYTNDLYVRLVASIRLSHTTLVLGQNGHQQLTATVLPSDANNKGVTWTSSDASVATVDANGLVTAVAIGSCTITCAATDSSTVQAICQLTVCAGNSGTVGGHNYVDLGLPSGTLWATMNVGASSPEDYGDYYAWGETTTKSTYKSSTYKYCDGSSSTLTKYCTSGSYGPVDNLTELELSDDAAYVNWDGEWRMPSEEQFLELINGEYTTIEWTTQNGVNGRLITSKSNSNSIFLPAAGERYDTSLDNTGSNGCYWSRSLDTNTPTFARSLYVYPNDVYSGYGGRNYGRSVRPVRYVKVTSITLSQTSLSLSRGDSQTLTVTILPSDANNKSIAWTSSDASVATVDANGLVTAVAVGSCTIACAATDGSGVTATCQLTVYIDRSGTIDGHESVDLGLPSGTLWATMNIGASSPEDYGDYFAWGETEGYNSGKTDFDWSTYKYCNGDYNKLTKYCGSSNFGDNGFTDNLTELEFSDDAAYVNWGSEWRMPSVEQFQELINSSYTTTVWTTQQGVNGYLITGKITGNSIFLPAAGLFYTTKLQEVGSDGYYLSRILYAHSSYNRDLRFGSDNIELNGLYRYCGGSVRPVHYVEVTSITLSQTSLSLNSGGTQTLTATVLPSDASNTGVTWASSDESVATVSSEGLVTAVGLGSCTITCAAKDGSGVQASCQVRVSVPGTHEYVDLGLPSGTLWATMNIGASSPEDYGDYFDWGETTTKSTYNWSTYKYCNGSENTLTKYCISYKYGTVDNLTELELSDDAAYVNWGGNWRMPSYDQFTELINSVYTTTEWTSVNGKYGRKITSKSNGNSIFLPAAGNRYNSSLYAADSDGYYWSRSLNTSYSNLVYILWIGSNNVSAGGNERGCGRSVRPVRASQ